MDKLVEKMLNAVGGVNNIDELDNCLTRVRFVVKDEKKITAKDGSILDGDNTYVSIHGKNVHVVVGLKASEYAKEVFAEIKNPSPVENSLYGTILEAVGGASNVLELDNCLTRIRFVVKDEKKVNKKSLSFLEKNKLFPIVKGKTLHIVAGTSATQYSKELKKLLE